jgi:hypothetical protein
MILIISKMFNDLACEIQYLLFLSEHQVYENTHSFKERTCICNQTVVTQI